MVSEIKTALAGVGLETVPNLDNAGIDDAIRFVRAGGAATKPMTFSVPVMPDDRDFESEEAAAQAESVSAPNGAESSHASEDQLEPETEDEQPVAKADDRPVTSQGTDWTISSLREKWERGQLDRQPKFQREYVWDQRPELPSRLIESALLEIPIPPIYFGRAPEGRLEIIDGQQRLTTLVNFVTNKFALRKLHSMPSLNHKFFRELTEQQQEKILDTPIRSIVIDAGRNTELRYEVFERLNRGSMQLNEQELRNCVYRGPFNDLLAELEQDSYWRKIKEAMRRKDVLRKEK